MAVEGTTCSRGRLDCTNAAELGQAPHSISVACGVGGLGAAAESSSDLCNTASCGMLGCSALPTQAGTRSHPIPPPMPFPAANHLHVVDGQPRIEAAPAVRAPQQRQRLRCRLEAQLLRAGRQLSGGRGGGCLCQAQALHLPRVGGKSGEQGVGARADVVQGQAGRFMGKREVKSGRQLPLCKHDKPRPPASGGARRPVGRWRSAPPGQPLLQRSA